MDATLKLKSWKIVEDEKTKLPKVKGEYDITAMGKVIATQAFNGDYGAIEYPFSLALMQKIQAIGKEIISEIEVGLK